MEINLSILVEKPSSRFKIFIQDLGTPSRYCNVQYWRGRVCFSSNQLISINGASGRTASVEPSNADSSEVSRFVSKLNAVFSLPEQDREILIKLCKARARQKKSIAVLLVTIKMSDPKVSETLQNLFSLIDSSN